MASSQPSSQPEATRSYALWPPEHSICLLRMMHDAWLRGIRSTQGGVAKDHVTRTILTELNAKFNSSYGIKQYENRLRHWKGKYANFSQLTKNGSGFGWDETSKLFTARNEVWDAYIISHLGSASLRTEKLEGWTMIEDMFQTIVATRESHAGLSAVASDVIRTEEREYLDAETPVEGEELPSESIAPSDTSTGTQRKRARDDATSTSRGSQRGGIDMVEMAEKFSQIEQHIGGMCVTYKNATEAREAREARKARESREREARESRVVDPWDALMELPEFDT